jgi:hypothetical protein
MPPAERYEELLRLTTPDALKENLVRAAVYIIAYEFLENLLKDRLENYYATLEDDALKRLNSWDGRGKLKPGKKYKAEVHARDKDDPVMASCRWFEDQKVLTSEDIQFIKAARQRRGNLAHEMPNVLLRSGEQVDVQELKHMCELAFRIDNWWLVNMEDAPANAQSLGAMLLRYFNEVVVGTTSPNGLTVVSGSI